jgi:hypothetical protein
MRSFALTRMGWARDYRLRRTSTFGSVSPDLPTPSHDTTMKYLHVLWRHSLVDEPVELLSEIDDVRFEVRRIEIFRDRRKGFASSTESGGDTRLSVEALPSLAEIASDPQFQPHEISKHEFELAWKNRNSMR